MKLNIFNGGLSTRLDPQFIEASEAVEYVNVDNTQAVLEPVKDKTATGILVDQYHEFFIAGDEWLSSSIVMDYLEFDRIMYTADRVGVPQKYNGIDTFNLGIEAPSRDFDPPKPFTSVNYSFLAGAGNLITSVIEPAFTYLVINEGDVDSPNFEFTVNIPAITKLSITLSNFAPASVFAGAIRLYREQSGIFRLLGTLTSVDTTFTDDVLAINTNDALARNDGDFHLTPTSRPGIINNTEFTILLTGGDIPDNEQLIYLFVNKDPITGFESESVTTVIRAGTNANINKIDLINTFNENFLGSCKVYRQFNGTFRLIVDFAVNVELFLDDTFDISSNLALQTSVTGDLNGTYTYALTYLNSADGTESQPGLLTETIVDEGFVTIGDIPVSSDPQVDKKRIYRVGGTLLTFTLVEEINNSVTDFVDIKGDIDVEGTILVSTTFGQAPAGLQFLTEYAAVIFGAIGNKLFFSLVGLPNAWSAFNFLDFDLDITGIGKSPNGILVFTELRTHIVVGTEPSSFAPYILSGDQGCRKFESISHNKSQVIWVSDDGVCVSSGSDVEVITKNKLGKLDLDIVDSVIFDEVYYAQKSDGTTFAVDIRFGIIFKDFSLDIIQISKSKDILYGWKEGELYTLFTSLTNLSFTYKSPVVLDGAFTHKTYKYIRVYSEGSNTVVIFIDDVIVGTHVLTTTDNHQLPIPQTKQRGFFLQFKITGTGKIKQINSLPTGVADVE